MCKPKAAVIASWIALVLTALLGTVPATGATVYGFEGDTPGDLPTYPLEAPDGWYVPNVPTTKASSIVPYTTVAGFGVATDPTGGDNALALGSAPSGTSAKAQTNVNFSAAPIWTISFDLCIVNLTSDGNTYDTDWIGSLAPQSISGNFSDFFLLNGWDNPTAASTWSAYYSAHDASGNLLDPNGVSPGAAWTGLSQNHWYIESTTFDGVTDRILSVSITDMNTNSTTAYSPSGWYMLGGSTPLSGLDSLRLRGYGSTNGMLVDNVTLSSSSGVPEPASFALLGTGLAALAVAARRRRNLPLYQDTLVHAPPPA